MPFYYYTTILYHRAIYTILPPIYNTSDHKCRIYVKKTASWTCTRSSFLLFTFRSFLLFFSVCSLFSLSLYFAIIVLHCIIPFRILPLAAASSHRDLTWTSLGLHSGLSV